MSVGQIRILLVGLVAGVLVSFQACSPPASSRRPAGLGEGAPGQMQNNGGTTTDNPKPTVDVSIMPHSVSAILEAQICVEDVRLKKVVTSQTVTPTGSTSYTSTYSNTAMQQAAATVAKQLYGRDIFVVREGTYIDAFTIPRGTFNVVELVLGSDCPTPTSLRIRTAGGTVGTSSGVVMRFNGNASTIGASSLSLNMQPILEALSKASSEADIQRILGSVHGTFQ